MSKRNKSLIALLLVLCVGLVGLTIAYFSNSTEIENEFITKEYGTTYTEEFVSPDNWLPGDTTDKIVTVTNSGEVDEAVRISLSETWTPNNANATLTGWIHADGTKSNHTTEEELATDVRAAIINFTDNSDWTKVGDYYYYNYRLQPGETTDSLIESVTFNALTKLGDTCTPSTSNGVTTITCNSSGSDYDHATYTLSFTIETVQYNEYQEVWGTNVAIAEEKPLIVYGLNVNSTSKTYETGDKGEMFALSHNGITDYRYIGDAPNNYVYFNCDEPQEGVEYNYANSCETWRIIGVFDVDDGQGHTEQRIKLVRDSVFATSMAFHGTSWSNEKNDWTISNLKIFLNGDFYNRQGDAATYGLKASARGMIGNAVYYLGAVSYNGTYGTTEKIYGEERGNIVCASCNSDTTKLTWTGIVGLMYPSDMYMVYGNDVNVTCYTNPFNCSGTNAQTGWVYNSNSLNGFTWFLSSHADRKDGVLGAIGNGNLGAVPSYKSYGVRPVLYLSSNVKITDGTGEQNNPYKLGL